MFVASVEQGLTTAVSIFSIFLSQWFTSVIVLLFITFWKQEDKESAMDDIEEFTLEPILCLRHQNLELTKNNEKLQITILKEQVSTLQRKLAAVEEELEKIKNENKQFHLISLKGNMLIDNFRKTTKQFFNARCITVTERKADIIDEKQSEIAVQTSDECITQYDSIPNLTSLEDQTYTNKIIVNDLAGYKRLTPDQYVCINDGQVVFENIPEEINTQVILRTEPVKREEKCLENIYRMVWEQDSSETDSIGEVINPDDLQMFRKKFNDFCKLIPAMRFSSSSNLSTTTSEAETFDSSDYASDKTSCFAETTNLQVLYKPSQTSVICDSTIDYMKAMDGTNMGELMTRAISEDDMISALRVWNTSVKY